MARLKRQLQKTRELTKSISVYQHRLFEKNQELTEAGNALKHSGKTAKRVLQQATNQAILINQLSLENKRLKAQIPEGKKNKKTSATAIV